MRRGIYRSSRDEALELFRRAPLVHAAYVTPEGSPLFRTVHAVVVGETLAFHGAVKGEKAEAAGWPVTLAAEEVVAQIPSYFVDPERACPATTYYLSAQVSGRLESVDDAAMKCRVLSGLMEKYQPEGGYVPLAPEHPLYERALRGVAIFQLGLETLVGKNKLGQNRSPEELTKVIEALWRRGEVGDPAAIERVLEHNPGVERPPFLRAGHGVFLVCQLAADRVAEAAALLEGQYWNQGLPLSTVKAAQLGSGAWIGAIEAKSGRLIATARAISDGAKFAWIYDVAVEPAFQRRALGGALMRLLLDHPRLRNTKTVLLRTKDAERFYQKLGFVIPPSKNITLALDRQEA